MLEPILARISEMNELSAPPPLANARRREVAETKMFFRDFHKRPLSL